MPADRQLGGLEIPVDEASGLFRGRDMLCFSHDLNGDPLSKTHLMRLLSRDNRILWVNSIGYRTPRASKADMSRAIKKLLSVTAPLRESEPNIFVLNPLAVPFYGWAGRAINRQLLLFQVLRAMKWLRFERPINWVFNPAADVIAGSLGESALVYYCVDEYRAFSGVSSRNLGDLERSLLRKADLVVVSSDLLYRSKSRENPRTVLVRHGVDFDHFSRALDPETRVPEEIADLPKPVIGYFGLIGDDWIDMDVLVEIAKAFSHGSLVMIGKVAMDVSRLRGLHNVHLLGRRPYGSLPAYCKGFDAAIVPFPINEVTLNANPLKAREYLAAGLPVVSASIPEVEVLGLCLTAHDPGGFVRQLTRALLDPGPSRERSEAVRAESWQARLDDVCGHFHRLAARRRPAEP
jgi:glycosyltransferase involved in cell wall biosynthesis